ncbi:MAG: hypothetical protein OXD44_07455 [Gammaproteobacteria bacterium]|nr:hypothetical protein [Gammaproteobacteria bacterium]
MLVVKQDSDIGHEGGDGGADRRLQQCRSRVASEVPAREVAGSRLSQDTQGKAIPYGLYDIGRSEAWVNVGFDHDDARPLRPPRSGGDGRKWAGAFILKSASCSSPPMREKAEAPGVCRRHGDAGTCQPLSAGSRKWNWIEHRLFCHVTQNWWGHPLRTFETVVGLISNTSTDAEMRSLSLHRDPFHGDWNYELRPRKVDKLN